MAGETPNKVWMRRLEALNKLEHDDDFVDVIIEGFVNERSKAGVKILSTDEVRGSEQLRDEVVRSLESISFFLDYLETVRILGESAKQDLMGEDYE